MKYSPRRVRLGSCVISWTQAGSTSSESPPVATMGRAALGGSFISPRMRSIIPSIMQAVPSTSPDRMAAGVICQLQIIHPQLKCCEVLAYLPRERNAPGIIETMLPEGIECVPPRFAISWRNRWMVDHSDIVVVYMTRNHGGTSAAADYARRKGKTVINIAI